MDRALGIDVGVGKGLDLVAMDGERKIVLTRRRATLDDVAEAIGRLSPAIVAVDAPPAWAAAGRSRRVERDLHALGIHSFGTPSEEFATAWHGWMRVGFGVFDALAPRYPLYTGRGPARDCAVEVFPHGAAVALRGSIPPARTPKMPWRRAALEQAGVDTTPLRGLDQVDAALAALTGIRVLRGEVTWVGEPGVAVLALPMRGLPARFPRDSASGPAG